MATFKAIVEPHYLRTDGTYNIKIRVQHNNKKRYISSPWYITKQDLTKTFKIKTQYYIDASEDLCRQYRKICDKHSNTLYKLSIEQVVDIIKLNYNNNDDILNFDLDFIKFSREKILELQNNGRAPSASIYQVAINGLIRYAKREQISIHEINSKYIQGFINYLEKEESVIRKEKSNTKQFLYPTMIRALHNKAKKEYNDEDIGIVKIPLSPFKNIKLIAPKPTRKRAINIQMIQEIMDYPYSYYFRTGQNRYSINNLAKDTFLLSFFLVGMNSADLYNCSSYNNGIITYQRTKTKNRRQDKAEIQIKVEPEIQFLVEKYINKLERNKCIFEFSTKYSTPRIFNTTINKALKSIGDTIGVLDLEFYAARHSWATIARNDIGIDKFTIHEALNNVDESMKITDIYIDKDFSKIWEANKKIIELFDFSKLREMNEIS